MIASEQQQNLRARPRRRPSRVALCAFAVALALVASFAAAALASSTSVTVNSASSSKLKEQIAVNSQGRTLYALSGETASHLKCKSKECLKVWPPLTVPSRKTKLKAGSGLKGHLGILRRSNGTLQVTLRGLPVYRFSGDSSKGETNGQGIESFGGTWSAVPASTEASSPAPAPEPAPTMPSNPPYGY